MLHARGYVSRLSSWLDDVTSTDREALAPPTDKQSATRRQQIDQQSLLFSESNRIETFYQKVPDN